MGIWIVLTGIPIKHIFRFKTYSIEKKIRSDEAGCHDGHEDNKLVNSPMVSSSSMHKCLLLLCDLCAQDKDNQFFRKLLKVENLYEDLLSLKKYSFVTQQAYMNILEQLRRHLCFIKAYFINDVNTITTECLDYKSSFVYKNYSDRIPCIGNWPGFLMTKMPYVERELLPHLMNHDKFSNPQ